MWGEVTPHHWPGGGQRTRPSQRLDCGAHAHTRTAQGPTDVGFCGCCCCCCWGGTGLPVLVVDDEDGGGGVVVVVDHVTNLSIEMCLVVGCAYCDGIW